ncbi:deoxyribodipyrimidine photo-lyase/cryptochrome family protein [Croceimicrobium sp.]|uniref:cryptochrome/deoxyribodipyrimidine photo-lyase family protein n=1 Tax=Croceimicrobium sp. TaxID=2828340 RepID=UPI003BAABA49
MQSFQVLWLKRDLRWQDQDALQAALAEELPLIVLFCFEPLQMAHQDSSPRHRANQEDLLAEMLAQAPHFQRQFLILEADADRVLKTLIPTGLSLLHSHREHGLKLSYERDKRISEICRKANVRWCEYDHNGVQRALQNRDHWDENWRSYMQGPLQKTKVPHSHYLETENLEAIELALKKAGIQSSTAKLKERKPQLSREKSLKRLDSFLATGAQNYQAHIGSPDFSRKSCSRLSTALAWGALSLREVYQKSLETYQAKAYKKDLKAFISRLHWHSHFIQKFEMEMRMESENLNRGYNALRTECNPEYLETWKKGETGFPLVDACMRAVAETGYLNFRMRAMVVSFWSHILWQPWQAAVHHLAACFEDYIPGIHYPQFQMQSSVTGINTIRIYNPVKQSLEKDAEANFIREWLPELADLPLAFQHEPWKLSPLEQGFYNFKLGRDYPERLIDLNAAGNFAREQLWKMKKDPLVLQENQRILRKHTLANRSVEHRSRKVLKQMNEHG